MSKQQIYSENLKGTDTDASTLYQAEPRYKYQLNSNTDFQQMIQEFMNGFADDRTENSKGTGDDEFRYESKWSFYI